MAPPKRKGTDESMWVEQRIFFKRWDRTNTLLDRIADALEGKVDDRILRALNKLSAVLDAGKEITLMSAKSDAVLGEIDAIITKVKALQASQSGMTDAEKADIDAKLA